MSHYTVGVGSRLDLQRYAQHADKARSAALRHAVGVLIEAIRGGWRGRPPSAGMASLQR